MRKITFSLLSFVLICPLAFGGINTNTNQSASWVRMLIRDASTDIDAVYYNPAGLTKLPDGFHVSINNQFITQEKSVMNEYWRLNNGTYEGKVSAYLFPGIYAAFKTGKFVFSAGFNPIGGGGGATFDEGLPSFEMPPSDLQTIPGVTAYSLNTSFEGTSAYLGIQAGVSYAIHDMISVYAGARYIMAKNTYAGHLKEIMVTTAGGTIPATTFMGQLAAQMISLAGVATSLQPIIDGGLGGADLATVQGLGLLTPAQVAGIVAGWALINPAVDPMTLNIATIQGGYALATPTFLENAAEATAKQTLLADQEVDVEQSGSGITPIIGVNLSPTENFNIAIKYEFATKIEVENATPAGKGGLIGLTPTGEPVYLFPDKALTRGDLPAMLAVGVGYTMGPLSLTGGLHYYFDKSADYGKTVGGVKVDNADLINSNNWEAGFAIQYALNDRFTLSAGYQHNEVDVTDDFQSDLEYDLNTNTVGAGLKFRLNDMLSLNLGLAYASYVEGERTFDYFPGGGDTPVRITENLDKNALLIGLGLDLSF